MNQLLTARQLAALLAVSVKTVYRLSRAGELPAVWVGGSLRFDSQDAQTFVEASKNGTLRAARPDQG